ncbi:MAG: InlB B-repeat-containing protein [Bacilli bacterium]|nr:InlB B-repeat-containing protein [Bacilli bacterium]
MKKKYKDRNNYIYLVAVVTILTIVFLTIGFSDSTIYGNIDNIGARVRIQRDIRITEVTINNALNNAVSSWETENVKTVAAGISLPDNNSQITYNVKVMNIGNMEAVISNISGLPGNLTYTLNNYNLNDVLCDDNNSSQCKLGSVTTIAITIKYAANGYNSSNTDYNIALDFTFDYTVDSVAKIGANYYNTLQAAINAVPNDKTETTITLLKNISETVSMTENKNIVLDLNYHTLSNNQNKPVISNKGILKLTNGIITTDAATNGAVNNESSGTIVIDGVRIIVTGGRQAFYNNKGKATITGSSYLYSEATERAACQNVSGGTMTILGGTIISTGSAALNNAGTLTIGTKDGEVSSLIPSFQGTTYGITSTTNYKFYDGIVKATGSIFNDVNKITEKEVNSSFIYETDGNLKIAYLAQACVVTFTANISGANLSESSRSVLKNHELGTLPTVTKAGYEFLGWYTQSSGGEQINASTVITENITFFGHWMKNTDVASIGDSYYGTLSAAVNAAPDNIETTITMHKTISEWVVIPSTKNIILNGNNITLTNNGNKPIIENNGTITINNAVLNSGAAQAAINNLAGHLIVNNSRVVETSAKQAMYITGGTVEITGNSYFESQTYGTPDGSTMERGTVQVISGNLIVHSGTIVGTKQQAISNEGTLTIGVKDGSIDSSSPVLMGAVHGIRNAGTFNFYDGIIKGKNDAIYGNVDDQETDSQIVIGSETISNNTYITAQLVLDEE